MSSVSGFLNNHSFGNGVPGSRLSGLQQRGGVVGAKQDPMTFTSSSSPGQQQFLNNYGSDRQPSPQLDAMQNFHAPHSQQQQQQLHGGMFNEGNMGPVKSEEPGEQNSSQRGGIKLEHQQLQSLRGLVPVKMDSQHSEQSMFLQHHQQQKQQQQQQILQLSRQNSPNTAAQLNMLQHQRIMQLQQHQHQQLQQHQQQSLNTLPQQRTQLQQQLNSSRKQRNCCCIK